MRRHPRRRDRQGLRDRLPRNRGAQPGDGRGSGLGLAIVAGVARAHGGSAHVVERRRRVPVHPPPARLGRGLDLTDAARMDAQHGSPPTPRARSLTTRGPTQRATPVGSRRAATCSVVSEIHPIADWDRDCHLGRSLRIAGGDLDTRSFRESLSVERNSKESWQGLTGAQEGADAYGDPACRPAVDRRARVRGDDV